ncbi:hypothetical protein SAMN04515695_3305 [Pseudovibrio sp. Tun.PSC04-5.I4]|nr:hypothetical protein SAMN04515695_3305 [Pseudovibrio sp. Tun.PSC04-5.I4]
MEDDNATEVLNPIRTALCNMYISRLLIEEIAPKAAEQKLEAAPA